MPTQFTAHVVLAACAVVFSGTACSRAEHEEDEAPIAALAFRADSAAPNLGGADVAPLDPEALERLQRANPTLEEWQEILAVYTGSQVPPAQVGIAVLGSYSIAGDTLRFTPRFPPAPGQSYVARYNGSVLLRRVGGRVRNEGATAVFMGDSTTAPGGTRVLQVYPTSDRVPVNLLKLYIVFSAPMRMGEMAGRMRLVNDSGRVIDDAFLNVPQELWDSDKRRLTVLFDPGRIKRDLRPHEELGLPLQERRAYTLTIESGWKDANGNPLARAFEKRFTVDPADRSPPRPAEWQIAVPAKDARGPLTLDFPEPLDYGLLQRVIAVKGGNGQAVAGEITIGQNERQWRFTPAQNWAAGEYILEVGAELEDLAGNNLTHVFDRPHSQAARAAPAAHVEMRFRVR